MTSECTRVLAEISAYLDGDLDQATCQAIDQHCVRCADCAAIVDDLKANAGLCRQLGSRPLPPAVLDRARASLRRLLQARSTKGHRSPR